jgi:Fe-S oxidoreductase
MPEHAFKNLKEVKDLLDICFKCSFCSGNCPIVEQIFWASFSPRGKMLILRSLLSGQGTLTDKVRDGLYTCTLCSNCDNTCIAGIKVTDVLAAGRRDLYELGKAPENVNSLISTIKESGNVFDLDPEDTDFLGVNPRIEFPETADLLFFKGCYATYHSVPNKNVIDSFNILRALDVDFTVLKEEECCGSPAYLLGDMDTTRRFCEYNVSKIEEKGVSRVVTTCPGCYRALKQVYPKFVGKLNFEVLHITELLAEYIDEGKLVFNMNGNDKFDVLYHDPCELGRHCGVYEAPRKILEAIPSVNLEEFDKNRDEAKCCGGGGGLTISNPNLAHQIAQIRLQEAEERGIPTVITACPACLLNFAASRDRYNLKVKIVDINQLVGSAISSL